MISPARILVDPSQFPARVRSEFLQSLSSRQVNHKFLYEGVKQAHRWLAVHQAFSPWRTDPDCAQIYDDAFKAAAKMILAANVHLLGLGCGDGQKDIRLLGLLQGPGRTLSYTPADVSEAMVLLARGAALSVIPDDRCQPLVIDLAIAEGLPGRVDSICLSADARLITFFGMLPNFEPGILAQLAAVLGSGDLLLLSANLAPGPDYDRGVQRILPLYDNKPTRDWLLGFTLDLGLEQADGTIRFVVEEGPAGSGLRRVAAYYQFEKKRALEIYGQEFLFHPGDSLRLFFSYRHTPALLRQLLEPHNLKISNEWITKSQEEGVFLVARS